MFSFYFDDQPYSRQPHGLSDNAVQRHRRMLAKCNHRANVGKGELASH